MDVEYTDYVGCGFNWGVQVWFISAVTPSTMTISNPLDAEMGEITLTRQGGGAGILGAWNVATESITFSITFNDNNTFIGEANIDQCN